MIRLLFLCLGNICRSPIAEGICRARIESGILDGRIPLKITWDSAGLGGWHEGSLPDPRSIAVGKKHGIEIGDLRARKIRDTDFADFDYILAMDRDNLRAVTALCPPEFQNRLHLLMDFASGSKIREVPDPYYFKDTLGFERVYATIEEGVDGLLQHLGRI